MSKKIEFVDSWEHTPIEYYPTPAIKDLPTWYKNTESYINGAKNVDRRTSPNKTNGTIKKCKPVWDALTSGYLLKLPADVNVRLNEDGSHFFEWARGELVHFHPVTQAPQYPGQEGRKNPYPKFNHPWIIKTPPGYSTLFAPPAHREAPFRILEGVVDTDSYPEVVLLPFVFNKPDFEGLIPAGTPIAQVTPLKRESWVMNARPQNEKDRLERLRGEAKLGSLFNDSYKTFFWSRKEYK